MFVIFLFVLVSRESD